MFNKNRACQHLRLNGLNSTESSRFSSLIKKWHDNSGPEWTVKRLKTLEQYAKDKYLGKRPSIPLGWAVSETRSGKRFRDGLLHELFSSKKFDLELALQFCRLASAISLREWRKVKNEDRKGHRHKIVSLPPSKEQWEKTLTGIEGPTDKEMNREVYNSALTYLCTTKGGAGTMDISKYPKVNDSNVVPMVFWPVVETTAPYFDKFGKVQTASRNRESKVWSLEILYNDSSFATFLSNNREYVTKCIFGDVNYLLPLPAAGSSIFELPVGAFSVIQEQGCKLRAVSSPFLAIQAINEPLKVQLTEISKIIPEIVTYNQQEGRDHLKHWMESETKVWSIDASSFTDRFPLEFQVEVLRKLLSKNKITQQMFDAFTTTTKHKYYSPELERNISYEYGQPQGLGPSFVLATLAHYELLDSLRKGLGIKNKPFRLVGDDVIISDERLAHSYMLWMESSNVEINQAKTIISNSLGEFAGAQVTRDKIIMRPKLGHLNSNDAVVSLFDIFNDLNKESKFLHQMEREFGKFAQKIHLPEDFGGRRHMLYQNDMTVRPLDDFNVVKSRLVKEVSELIPYSQHDIIKFFEKKRWLTTGILHSSAYLDNPSMESKEISIVQNATKPRASNLEKSLIADILDAARQFLSEIKSCKDLKSLRFTVLKFSKLMDRNGYLIDKKAKESLASRDFLHQLVQLVGVEQEQLKVLDEATRKRKSKSRPAETGWSRYLK